MTQLIKNTNILRCAGCKKFIECHWSINTIENGFLPCGQGKLSDNDVRLLALIKHMETQGGK